MRKSNVLKKGTGLVLAVGLVLNGAMTVSAVEKRIGEGLKAPKPVTELKKAEKPGVRKPEVKKPVKPEVKKPVKPELKKPAKPELKPAHKHKHPHGKHCKHNHIHNKPEEDKNDSALNGGTTINSAEVDGFVINLDTGAIIDYTGDSTAVVIPAQLDGTDVVSISANAFADSGVSSVVIPESIESLEADAFAGCDSLTAVYCYVGSAAGEYDFADGVITYIGDLNSDGEVNNSDAALLLRAVTLNTVASLDSAVADYNLDGVVDMVDVNAILATE